MGRKDESRDYDSFKELVDNCQNKGYFRGIRDAVFGEMMAQLSQPYLSGWDFGYRSQIRIIKDDQI